jgi:hypothetical protein
MSVSANIGAIWAWSSQETAATGESRTVVELLVAVADELDPPRSLSPTSARTWQQCELRYALSYLYGWQEGATLPQVVGNTVHRAVELLYGLDPSQRRRDVAGQLLRVAGRGDGPGRRGGTGGTAGELAEQVTSAGEDALDGLFVLEDPARITVDPKGLEVRVVAELYGVPVRGRIDRIYDASGAPRSRPARACSATGAPSAASVRLGQRCRCLGSAATSTPPSSVRSGFVAGTAPSWPIPWSGPRHPESGTARSRRGDAIRTTPVDDRAR